MAEAQETELKDALARDKHCLAAAELELVELTKMRTQIEERIAYTERAVKDLANKVCDRWQAVRRRIDQETDSPLDADLIHARCAKLLGPTHNV